MRALSRAPGGAALYAAAFLVEWFVCATVRYAVTWPLAWVVLALTGAAPAASGATVVAAAAAWLPLVLSLAALAGVPGGAHLTRLQLGARQPSRREWDLIDDALAQLEPRARAPWRIYVVDEPLPSALAVGSTLYLHRGLLADPALPAVVAHELGHLGSIDGRLLLALRRLAPFPSKRRYAALGGLSYIILRHSFEAWMRHREHVADRYAAAHGQAFELAEFLDRRQLFDLAVPYLSGRAHPYAEHRVDRLLAAAETQP